MIIPNVHGEDFAGGKRDKGGVFAHRLGNGNGQCRLARARLADNQQRSAGDFALLKLVSVKICVFVSWLFDQYITRDFQNFSFFEKIFTG
jgi:hypothetical protein